MDDTQRVHLVHSTTSRATYVKATKSKATLGRQLSVFAASAEGFAGELAQALGVNRLLNAPALSLADTSHGTSSQEGLGRERFGRVMKNAWAAAGFLGQVGDPFPLHVIHSTHSPIFSTSAFCVR